MKKDKKENPICSSCNKSILNYEYGYITIGIILCKKCSNELIYLTRKNLTNKEK